VPDGLFRSTSPRFGPLAVHLVGSFYQTFPGACPLGPPHSQPLDILRIRVGLCGEGLASASSPLPGVGNGAGRRRVQRSGHTGYRRRRFASTAPRRDLGVGDGLGTPSRVERIPSFSRMLRSSFIRGDIGKRSRSIVSRSSSISAARSSAVRFSSGMSPIWQAEG
jgi:hypothetical protein